MSFFDLENELPGWLGGVIAGYKPKITEMTPSDVIAWTTSLKLDESYYSIAFDKGTIATGGNGHDIWRFQEPIKHYRTYGKYLEYNGTGGQYKFWVGLYVAKNIMDLYLWFPRNPTPTPILNHINSKLQPLLVDDLDNNEHWFKNEPENSPSKTFVQYCGCGSPPLNQGDLKTLEGAVKTATNNLFKAFP